MSPLLDKTQVHWQAIGPWLTIHTEHDYDLAVRRLNNLLDEIGDDEEHPLYGLLDTLGTLIYAYEEEHLPVPEATGTEVLEFLMEEHRLSLEDLPELGARDAVQAILSGAREMHLGQVRALAERFGVPAAVFI